MTFVWLITRNMGGFSDQMGYSKMIKSEEHEAGSSEISDVVAIGFNLYTTGSTFPRLTNLFLTFFPHPFRIANLSYCTGCFEL